MIDRLVLGLTSIFVSPHRISKLSVSIRPATLTQVPQGVGPSKISPTVLLVTPEAKAWPERAVRATHRGHRRDETPQSQVRLCPPHWSGTRSRVNSLLHSLAKTITARLDLRYCGKDRVVR
jgi:hypothetical protein